MKKPKSEYERFMALSDAQKDAEVAKYDSPPAVNKRGLPGRPLRASDKALHRRAASRGGRPKIGRGAVIVPISIERGLLEQVNSFARINHLKRSQMVAEGLKLLMSSRRKAG